MKLLDTWAKESARIPRWNLAILDIPLVRTSPLGLKFIRLNVAIPCVHLSVTECSKVALLRSGETRRKQAMGREAGFRNSKARLLQALRSREEGRDWHLEVLQASQDGRELEVCGFSNCSKVQCKVHTEEPGSRPLQMPFLNGHGCAFPSCHSDGSSSESQPHVTPCLSVEPVLQAICT